MTSAETTAKGFNLEVNQEKNRQYLFRWVRRAVISLGVLGIILSLGASYFASLPRDPSATPLSFFERARDGASRWWSATFIALETPETDLAATKLPVIELYVRGDRLDALTSSLPISGEVYQSAMVKLDDKIEKAEVRFRGDAVNHWGFPSKSWRINLKNTKGWEGMQYLNLNMPRSASQMENWIGYTLANRMGGLLVPYAEFVQFRLNRQYDGIRLLIEQVNEDFLVKRGLQQGKIFAGDIALDLRRTEATASGLFKIPSPSENPWTLLVGQLEPVKFAVPAAWEVRSMVLGEGVTPIELERLLAVINSSPDKAAMLQGLTSLIDVEMFLRYMAFLDIVGSTHIDELHNQRLYFNPTIGKFQPIVWDTIAYLQNNPGVDLAANGLFKAILSIPELRERKDQILWKTIRGPLSARAIATLVTQKADDIRSDVYAFPHKLHADDAGVRFVTNDEWEVAVKDTVARAKSRNDMISRHLSATRAIFETGEMQKQITPVLVQVRSPSGVQLQKIVVSVSPPTARGTLKLRRTGLPLTAKGGEITSSPLENGTATFEISDSLYSDREFGALGGERAIPMTYGYEIVSPKGIANVSVVEMSGKNSVTGKGFALAKATIEKSTMTSAVPAWWDSGLAEPPQTITLRGNKTLTSDIVLEHGESLVIEAGTTLTLGARVSIIVRGGDLIIKGTKERPVTFLRGDKDFPWGVIAANGSKSVRIEHAKLQGGSEKFAHFVRYEGMLSLHDSVATISNLFLDGGYLSAWNSTVTIEDSTVKNIFERPFDAHFTTVNEARVTHERVTPMHTARLIKGKAHGTPSHIEREHKYAIKAGDLSLYDVGKKILLALQEDVEITDKWHAPKYTGNNYYADTEVLDFAYRDFYFDTPDDLLVNNDVSYRFRNRFRSLKTHERHIREPHIPRFWPFRLEYQAKVGRDHPEAGYSIVDEARFEFRKQSKPFNEDNVPPFAPWDVEEFIPHFQTGEYKGIVTTSGEAVYRFLDERTDNLNEFYVEPRTVVITERLRQHLNMKSDWGSGPNPEQSFIISIDRSEIFDPTEYLTYVTNRQLGGDEKNLPTPRGSFIEFELEYERNVSDVLDKEITAAEKRGDSAAVAKLSEARDAFIKDQNVILAVIKEHLEAEGIPVVPAPESKYLQSFKIVYPRGRS